MRTIGDLKRRVARIERQRVDAETDKLTLVDDTPENRRRYAGSTKVVFLSGDDWNL